MIDAISLVDTYTSSSDWRIKENANAASTTLSGLANYINGKVTAEYWLDKIYTKEQGELHRTGAYHIHDLSSLSAYCVGHDLRDFLEQGLTGVEGRISSNPPKHLRSALDQMSNYLSVMASEWAGASSFSSADTFLAPFVREDNLSDEEIRQGLQSFIYNCNLPNRSGFQSPFINLTFDILVPEDLKEDHPIIDGEVKDYTYGDLQNELDRINIQFCNVMLQGDSSGRGFTFPIPTYSIVPEFDWDSEVSDKIFELTQKYGSPYFSNYLNSDMAPSDVRSMCCRLRLDLEEVRAHTNSSLFGSNVKTGSIGVVTINMPRLGYKHKGDMVGLYKELDYLLDQAAATLNKKRIVVSDLMEQGFYPYSKHYFDSFDSFFNTIGINGYNEMVLNYSNGELDLTSELGQDMCVKISDHILDRLKVFQLESGNLFNFEATPSEGATHRFAHSDKKLFPDIITAGSGDNIFYTNSSHIPVGTTSDVFETLDLSDKLQTQFTGGTVIHMYTDSSISDTKTAKTLVKTVCTNYKLPFVSVSPTFIICKKDGYTLGDHDKCPTCHSTDVEHWLRVMGYCRPVSSFNEAKVGEYKERTYYDVSTNS